MMGNEVKGRWQRSWRMTKLYKLRECYLPCLCWWYVYANVKTSDHSLISAFIAIHLFPLKLEKIVICVFQWDSLRKLILDSSHMLNLTILRAKVIPNSLAFETSILPKPTWLLSSKAKELTAVDILMFQCMLGTCCCHCPLVAFADGVLSYKML